MSHDATKVQMGTTQTSFKDVGNLPGTMAAGLLVRAKSDGTYTNALADGGAKGISLGLSQSGTPRFGIVYSGIRVPVLLTNGFTPVVGAAVSISDTTGKAIAAGAGASVINATYSSAKLKAIGEDGAEIADGCAYIDMPGGV